MEKVAAFARIQNASSTNMPVNLSSEADLVQESGCFHGDAFAIKIVRILPYFFIITISLIGNSLVVAVVFKNQRMWTTVNFYIVNMAVADLLITIYMPRTFTVAFVGYEWLVGGTAGQVFCKMSILLNQIPMIVSTFTVVAISFDRFNAVVFPLKTLVSTRICKVIILCTWLVALAFRIPTIYAVEIMTRESDGKLFCYLRLDEKFGFGVKRIYYHFNMIAIFSVPLLMIVIFYTTIIVTLKRRKTPGLTPENSSNNSEGFRRREVVKKKVLRLVSIVVTAFVLCWSLYYVRLSMFAYGRDLSCDWLYVRLLLAHMNSALNPCLYAIFSENYRRGFKKILARANFCKRRFQRADSLRSVRWHRAWDSNGSISIRIEPETQKPSSL
ncbi:octopamine receptor Oamb-like [Stylophora pistillata]|uniref:octopamine receptor Oamb-like n=1 Tax=Stylophora pistillata TaxID=50429 RepID=UPI000C04B908|nr:octopamine receptor Oamb-like [Stylophora pistillata]